jgi:hypothetical protein
MTKQNRRLVAMIRIGRTAVLAVVVAAWAGTAAAGKATVVKATATASGNGAYSFSATVAHADTGWKHFADKFGILTPNGKVLGTRVLVHPHVDEQPFTRSLGNVKILAGIDRVIVRAWDNVHKAGEETFTVKLPGR